MTFQSDAGLQPFSSIQYLWNMHFVNFLYRFQFIDLISLLVFTNIVDKFKVIWITSYLMFLWVIIFIFKNNTIAWKVFSEHFSICFCKVKCHFDDFLIRNSLMLVWESSKSHFVKREELLDCVFLFQILKIYSPYLEICIVKNIMWFIWPLSATGRLRKPRGCFWSHILRVLFWSNFSDFWWFFRSNFCFWYFFRSYFWFWLLFWANFTYFWNFLRSNFTFRIASLLLRFFIFR